MTLRPKARDPRPHRVREDCVRGRKVLARGVPAAEDQHIMAGRGIGENEKSMRIRDGVWQMKLFAELRVPADRAPRDRLGRRAARCGGERNNVFVSGQPDLRARVGFA